MHINTTGTTALSRVCLIHKCFSCVWYMYYYGPTEFMYGSCSNTYLHIMTMHISMQSTKQKLYKDNLLKD